MKQKTEQFIIREASRNEFDAIGKMTVEVYSNLPDIPSEEEMPKYYALLRNTLDRAEMPTVKIFVAVDHENAILGSVTFVGDMRHYASGGKATSIVDSSGFRLLAVGANTQGMGVGKALTEYCIDQARALGSKQLLMHTTKSMQVAWGMYERMGFTPMPEIDFQQASLSVYGFCLPLSC